MGLGALYAAFPAAETRSLRLTLGSVGRSSTPGNDGPETALAGWGGRTRTAESDGIKIRRCCGGWPKMAQRRRFALELRRGERAAAVRISAGHCGQKTEQA